MKYHNIKKIKTEDELNNLFKEMTDSLYIGSKEEEDLFNAGIKNLKEELTKKLQIDKNFFDENYILCVTDKGTGEGGFDYIEYNKISRKINLLQKREMFENGEIAMTESNYIYFVKLDKKYLDCEVEWKIKKVLFDL